MGEIKLLYTTLDNVKIRLANKVLFQKQGQDPVDGEIPTLFLLQLISDAETDIEQELRGRYAIPFQSKKTGTFKGLPDHTARAIRKVIDMKAVLSILDTDFARGSHIRGEDYAEEQRTKYQDEINRLLGHDQEAAGRDVKRWRFTPPLEDLKLAHSNSEADDGLRGMIINTDDSTNDAVSYAEEQINNPAFNYASGAGRKLLP